MSKQKTSFIILQHDPAGAPVRVGKPSTDFEALQRKADQLNKTTNQPASHWVAQIS